jgi:hypothetical protein
MHIYVLKEPRNNGVRYVGKTKMKLTKRLNGHYVEKKDTRKRRWLDYLLRENVRVNIEAIEEVMEYNWQEREKYWILYYRSLGCDLVNTTDGGDGVHNPSEEVRKKTSERTKLLMQDSEYRKKIFTKERSEKISKALAGKPKSKEHLAKLKQNQKGFKQNLSEDERNRRREQALNLNSKRIYLAHTEETKERIRQLSTGRKYPNRKPWSEEEKKKRSDATKGKPKSEEWKQKAREAALKRWERQRQLKQQLIQEDTKGYVEEK